jgi:ADP-ribosylglycohydrolase
MTISIPILKDRFEGCLFGLALGDALGGKFEAQTADAIRVRFPTAESLIAYPQEEIWYTDDAQMMIGVSEALIERGEIIEEVLCRIFVANRLIGLLENSPKGRVYLKHLSEQLFAVYSRGMRVDVR